MKKVFPLGLFAIVFIAYSILVYVEWQRTDALKKSRWHYRRGIVLQSLNDVQMAIREGEKGLTFSPEEPLIYPFLVDLLSAQNDLYKTLKMLEKGVEYFPDNIMLNLKLLRFYQKLGWKNKFNERWKNIEKFKKRWAQEMEGSGFLALKYRKWESAVKFFLSAITLNPNSPKAYYGLAIGYAMGGKFESALRAIEKALSFTPDEEKFLKVKKMLLERLKK